MAFTPGATLYPKVDTDGVVYLSETGPADRYLYADTDGKPYVSATGPGNITVVADTDGQPYYSTAAAGPSGSGVGSWTFTGAGTGKRSPKASGSGSWVFLGAGSGKRSPVASGSGSWVFTGSGTGYTPPLDGRTGSGVGTWTFTGSGSGVSYRFGSGAGTVAWTGAGTGASSRRATGSGSVAWSGAGTGYAGVPVDGLVTVPLRVRVGVAPTLGFYAPNVPVDLLTIPLRVTVDVKPRLMLTPAPVPVGLSDEPIRREAIIMDAPTAADPYPDFTVDRGDVGRWHAWVRGQDVTFLRGVAALIADVSSSVPMGYMSGALEMPQIRPWDVSGIGDLAAFDMDRDPPLEVGIVKGDGTVDVKWSGYLASEGDSDDESDERRTYKAEGLLAQAGHAPWDPPLWMPPTDVGHLIADALNAVPHRRWRKMARVTTGVKLVDRGSADTYVLQQVQNWLSKAWTLDGRQWTITWPTPDQPVLALKSPMTHVDFTFTHGARGVVWDGGADQSQRYDAVYGRGQGDDGGVWENRFFPGLDFGVPPTYPMASAGSNISVGTTDADTVTGRGVTDWQEQMVDLGFPVKVDGVMNANDTQWVRAVQKRRGLTVDGSLGPQTWAATFENNSTEVDTSSVRLPLARRDDSAPRLYAANGADVGPNPADDSGKVIHAKFVDFGQMSKADAIPLAEQILARESVVGIQGTLTVKTDPHEAGTSRLDVQAGHNIWLKGVGVLQVADVSHGPLQSTFTLDTRARDAMSVEAILERDADVRRNLSARPGVRDKASLVDSGVVPFESESRAGRVTRTAVNGNTGLWTGRKIFVSQIGVAKVDLHARSPKAEFVAVLAAQPIPISVLASRVPDPLASKEGWFDHVEELKKKYRIREVFGTPDSPCGYWPRSKSEGPLTGDFEDEASLLYDSPYGGFMWLYLFADRSTWINGRIYPAVRQ